MTRPEGDTLGGTASEPCTQPHDALARGLECRPQAPGSRDGGKDSPPAPGRLDPPRDCPVDIRNDNFIVPVPQIDGAFAATRALVLRGDTENHVIGAILQLQAFLKNRSHVSS